ncbi:hypothetical protein PHJA_002920400 [Phtheirospermum japonicum]|uniref:BED-type domain-containing protein n=1 Tax=Phtheirospermum japonicum TaxID=374723 RepID=A0A830DJI6_9LAMI|nr:hypothetical protein PHJA_002920400 [Phtheirospermum japonicum]
MGDERQHLLSQPDKSRAYARCASHAQDELHSFRTWLKWLCVDQSNPCTAGLSWLVFFVFAILVPALSHFVLACGDCDSLHSRPYDTVAQLSLTAVAAISFISLSTFVRRYGLRRFLFFDKLRDESETVRKGYTQQFSRSLKILFIFVLPCFAAESAYKIWWYTSGGTRIPFLGNVIVSNTVACVFELCSWFYRTMVFFLVCVLFRLICYLQILRMQDFALVFQVNSDVQPVLREHLRIRRHLKIISHRYRVFILWALIFITASQFASLLMTLRPNADVDIYHSGELANRKRTARNQFTVSVLTETGGFPVNRYRIKPPTMRVCSVSLLAGLLIILRSAARITHKAQAVTSFAAKWHVCATIDSFDTTETETPVTRMANEQVLTLSSDGSTDLDDVGDEEDELDNTKLVPSYAYNTISFQKRQALVAYLENNRAGITEKKMVTVEGFLTFENLNSDEFEPSVAVNVDEDEEGAAGDMSPPQSKPREFQSPIFRWHFTRTTINDESRAQCNYCTTHYAFGSNNNRGYESLKYHLEKKHCFEVFCGCSIDKVRVAWYYRNSINCRDQ